jgi:hypothetical protein
MEKKMTQLTSEIRDKSLYKTAWYCEYFAVAVGIYLAISLSVPGLGESPEFIDWINFGGIILILLFGAFVELTKIPIIRAFNSSRGKSRRRGMIVLFALLSWFTFDNLYQGTEQFIHYREKPIEKQRQKLVFIQEDIAGISKKLESLNLKSEKEIFAESNQALEQELSSINQQIKNAELERANLSNPKDTPHVTELKNSRQSLEKKREIILQQKQDSTKSFNDELSILVKGEAEALKNASFMQKKKIANEYAERKTILEQRRTNEMKTFNKQMNQIETDLNNTNNQIGELIEEQIHPVAGKIAEIDLEIKKLRNSRSGLENNSQARREAVLAAVTTNRMEAEAFTADIEGLREELKDERNVFFSMAKENNIYRMGEKVFGKEHPAELTREEIALISMIIMITTAAILSMIGPACAYFSLEEREGERKPKQNTGFKLRRTFRHLMVNMIKRIRKPRIVTELEEVEVVKEVVKEVPVEKTVVKEVEVPKPYEVTRYVGIPVPKDPEDLIEINTVNELDLIPAGAIPGGK